MRYTLSLVLGLALSATTSIGAATTCASRPLETLSIQRADGELPNGPARTSPQSSATGLERDAQVVKRLADHFSKTAKVKYEIVRYYPGLRQYRDRSIASRVTGYERGVLEVETRVVTESEPIFDEWTITTRYRIRLASVDTARLNFKRMKPPTTEEIAEVRARVGDDKLIVTVREQSTLPWVLAIHGNDIEASSKSAIRSGKFPRKGPETRGRVSQIEVHFASERAAADAREFLLALIEAHRSSVSSTVATPPN